MNLHILSEKNCKTPLIKRLEQLWLEQIILVRIVWIKNMLLRPSPTLNICNFKRELFKAIIASTLETIVNICLSTLISRHGNRVLKGLFSKRLIFQF